MILIRPIGSSVYTIFCLINPFAFTPISSPYDPDHVIPNDEPDRHHAAANFTETKVSTFRRTVLCVIGNESIWIQKCKLRFRKCQAMLALILIIFDRVPLE